MGLDGASRAPRRRTPQRQRRSVLAAALVGGSGDLLDFLLPLWAGALLGASPTQIGLLVATELAVSVAARVLAGHLADRHERTRVAALGALLYAVSCAGYALAPGLEVAFAAAVIGGAGGPLLWVSVRAIIAERHDEDSTGFANLTAAVAFTSWFFWIPGMLLFPVLGYRGSFTAFAAVGLLAALALLLAPTRSAAPGAAAEPLLAHARRLGPLLAVIVLLSAVGAGIGLLLLLRLQGTYELEVYQIALVYLPGGIAATVLPRPLHGLGNRIGRRRVYALASVASAICFLGLAVAPNLLAIAGLWVLANAGWAVRSPIHEAAVAESSGDRAGRGMSLLGNAALLGGAIGSAGAGALYDALTWGWTCLILGAVTATTAILGPAALRALGIRDRAPDSGD